MARRDRSLFRLKHQFFLLYCMAIGLFAAIPYLLPMFPVAAPLEDWSDTSDAMINMTLEAYKPDGVRRYYTESERLSHMHRDGLSTFEQFEMDYYSQGESNIVLRSEYATAVQGMGSIELGGVVTLEQFGNEGKRQRRMVTRDVEIQTDTGIAITEDEATLESKGIKTKGRGVIADLENGTIDFLEDVKTFHEM